MGAGSVTPRKVLTTCWLVSSILEMVLSPKLVTKAWAVRGLTATPSGERPTRMVAMTDGLVGAATAGAARTTSTSRRVEPSVANTCQAMDKPPGKNTQAQARPLPGATSG